jgi:HAD superfamily hydrolase (TIGR01549 family)
MKMDCNSVIFDLDGTLVHTTPEYRYMVVGSTLNDFDIIGDEKDIDDFWFLSEEHRERIVNNIWKLNLEEQFWPTFRKYDALDLRKKHTKVYDDVDILTLLKENKLKTGIVTSAPAHIIKLELSLLNHNFDSVIRAQLSEGVNQKPHPEGLIKCMNTLNTNPDNTIYVGNSKEDMDMAKNAGVYGILISRGEYDFKNVDPSLRINSLYELREFLGMKKN